MPASPLEVPPAVRASRGTLTHRPVPHHGPMTTAFRGGARADLTGGPLVRPGGDPPEVRPGTIHERGLCMTMTQTGRFSRRAVLEGMGVGALGLAGAALLG